MATSETPEQRARGRAEQQSLGAVQDAAAGRDPHERGADPEDRALDGDQRRQRRVLRVLGATAGQADDRQAGRCDRHADPLPPSEVEAEEALGEHGEEDEARRRGRPARSTAARARARRRGDTQATIATTQPITNHLERKSPAALRSGWRTRIGGATTAPRCLNRKATLVATAEASARISPKITTRLDA